MITANQLRAARALLNIDQRQTADMADLSVPTIQRMESSDGVIRANVDSLMKLVSALENAGIEAMTKGTPHQLLFSEGTRAFLSAEPADLVFYEEASVRGRTGTIKLWSLGDKPSDINRLDGPRGTVENAPSA